MAGGSNRQRKPSSILSMFKWCCSSGGAEVGWDVEPGYTTRRIYPSDEDRGYWVAEPGIDRRAAAFIARFHENSRL